MRDSLRHILSNPWVQAAVIAAIALAVYVRTLAPTVMWYDMGEFATAAYVLGIAHNTGYPLLMILGKLFTYLPVGDIAYRVNLMSAVFGALTAMVLYLIVFELTARRTAAGIAALTLAFTSTLWSNATWATSYDLNAFFTVLILWLMLRWVRSSRLPYILSASEGRAESRGASRAQPRGEVYLQAAVATFGLSLGNHRLILGAGLAVAYLTWRAHRQGRWRLRQRWFGRSGLAGLVTAFGFLLRHG